MELKGKYGFIDPIEVKIIIKRGLLSIYKNDKIVGIVPTPQEKKDYKIIRTDEEYGLPVTHKYAIKFTDYYNKECYVCTDMWIGKKWYIEARKSSKFKIWRLLFWIITIIAATTIAVLTENKINSFNNPARNTKTEQQNK